MRDIGFCKLFKCLKRDLNTVPIEKQPLFTFFVRFFPQDAALVPVYHYARFPSSDISVQRKAFRGKPRAWFFSIVVLPLFWYNQIHIRAHRQ